MCVGTVKRSATGWRGKPRQAWTPRDPLGCRWAQNAAREELWGKQDGARTPHLRHTTPAGGPALPVLLGSSHTYCIVGDDAGKDWRAGQAGPEPLHVGVVVLACFPTKSAPQQTHHLEPLVWSHLRCENPNPAQHNPPAREPPGPWYSTDHQTLT